MTTNNTSANPADQTSDASNSGTAGAEAPIATPAPVEEPKAKKKKPKSGVIWVQPGHPTYAVGQFVPCDEDTADQLRAKGFARVASPAEVELHTKEA